MGGCITESNIKHIIYTTVNKEIDIKITNVMYFCFSKWKWKLHNIFLYN